MQKHDDEFSENDIVRLSGLINEEAIHNQQLGKIITRDGHKYTVMFEDGKSVIVFDANMKLVMSSAPEYGA